MEGPSEMTLRSAFMLLLVMGFVQLSHAATSTTPSTNETNTSNNTTGATASNNNDVLENQFKVVVTIAAMALFIISGFLVARYVDKWYDKRDPPDDASDCSEKTRELLKKRVVLDAFQDMREAGKLDEDDEDLINEVITGRTKNDAEAGAEGGAEDISKSGKKMSKLWMLKTAFMGQKRKKTEALPEAPPAEEAEGKDEGKEQKIYTLPTNGKDGTDNKTRQDKQEFIDVQFTHRRVEESFTISKRVPQMDMPEGDNPYMYKYHHVSEDVLIPVRMMSPDHSATAAAAATHVTRKNSESALPKLGYYAELTLAPTRLGHYADSDFGSNVSLDDAANKTLNNNHDSAFQSNSDMTGKKEDTIKPPAPGGIMRRKSPSPTKRAHFSDSADSTDSPAKHTGTTDYEDDFESVSTYDNNGARSKRIATGRTDKTDYSFKTNEGSLDTPSEIGLTSARRQVNENAQASDTGDTTSNTNKKTVKPQQFNKSSTKEKGKAKKITVQPRI